MTLQNSDDLGVSINGDGFGITGGTTSARTLTLSGGNLPVSLSSPLLNQVLQFNGTNWVNGNITGVQGLTQRLYVDKSGNDTTGNPYLTIPAALASITDASLSKVYTVLVGAGTYSNNFSMPANVFIEGIDVVATAISGTVDINNSSWNTAGSPQMLSGFANLTFLGTTTSTFDFSTQANNEAGGLYFWNTRIQAPLVFNGQNATNNNQVVIENCKLNGGTITINGMAGAQINNTAGNNNSSVYVNALSAAGASCNLNNSTVDGTISVTGTNASYPVILNLNDAGVTSTTVLTANGSGVIINATVDSIPSLSRQTFGSGVTLNYNNPIYISTVNGSTGINVGTTAGNGGGTATLSLGTSGVTAGTYPFSTTVVDAYGRVTSATAGTPVTSVSLVGSNGIGIAGSPITSTGTITLSLGTITPTAINASGTINTTGSYLVGGTALHLNNLSDVNVGTAPGIGNFLIFSNSLNQWSAGTFLNYSSLGTSTTTSTTQQNKVSGTTGTLGAGQYLISWSYQFAYSTAVRTFIGQVLLDGTQLNVLNTITNTGATGQGAVNSQSTSGFQQVTLSAGTHTYNLTYGASNTSDTASIWNAYFKIQQLD